MRLWQRQTPCWGCGDRQPGCHGGCIAYALFHAVREADAAARRRENEIIADTPAMDAAKRAAERGRPSAPTE